MDSVVGLIQQETSSGCSLEELSDHVTERVTLRTTPILLPLSCPHRTGTTWGDQASCPTSLKHGHTRNQKLLDLGKHETKGCKMINNKKKRINKKKFNSTGA